MLKPNSTVTTNLIKARELIADENNWCTLFIEHDDGRHCAWGALNVVMSDRRSAVDTVEMKVLGRAGAALFPNLKSPLHEGTVANVNDLQGHAATMRMFDRAIELSLQDGT